MRSINALAPAKINLVLDVLGKRGDGFHEIRSLMCTVGLSDSIVIEEIIGDAIEVTCDSPDVPADSGNLAYRAADLLRQELAARHGCRISLTKRIPVGGGMGGGSSDAAAVLKGLNLLWDARLDSQKLANLGARIGSDIPFFFFGSCAIVTGRGECVQPIPLPWKGWATLVMTGVHVSTPDVYGRCNPPTASQSDDCIVHALQATTASTLSSHLRNGLEKAVFEVSPSVEKLMNLMNRSGAPLARVSGAGSVIYNLFDSKEQAQGLADSVSKTIPAQRVLVVPVPGPSQ